MSTVCLLLLHPALLGLFPRNRYSVAYSFYKTMSLWGNFWDVSKNLGVLWPAAAYGGVSLLLASGKTRLVCLRLLLAVVVAVVRFCRIQDM